MMFERFTERAQKVLLYAKQEAQVLNHGYVGTEHILLGLLKEQDGIPKKILNDAGITIDGVKRLIEEYEGEGKY